MSTTTAKTTAKTTANLRTLALMAFIAPIAASLLAAPTQAATRCTATGATIRTLSMCRYGAPVVVNRTLFVPKACRLPLAGKTIERHAVELRDATTGKKIGQASLPAKPAHSAQAPAPGALIGGPYPLFVWSGGIAAIDVSSKRARVVFEPTGRLAGVARYGEVLSIVDRLPMSTKLPTGGLEWTVLDFGAGELLGQLHLTNATLIDVGFGKEKGLLMGWIGVSGKKGPADLVAVIRGKDGKVVAKGGRLQARAERRSGRVMALTSGASLAPAGSGKPGAGDVCAVLTGRDPVLTDAVLVDISAAGGRGPVKANRTLDIAGCLAATPAGRGGLVWAWTRGKAGGPVLGAYQCGVVPPDARQRAPTKGPQPRASRPDKRRMAPTLGPR